MIPTHASLPLETIDRLLKTRDDDVLNDMRWITVPIKLPPGAKVSMISARGRFE